MPLVVDETIYTKYRIETCTKRQVQLIMKNNGKSNKP